MMAMYRRNDVVEATQWNKPGDYPGVIYDQDGDYVVMTRLGFCVVEPGNWIVKDEKSLDVYDDETFRLKFKRDDAGAGEADGEVKPFTLCNRADGVDGHYAIGRERTDRTWELWSPKGWGSAGSVFVLETTNRKLGTIPQTRRLIKLIESGTPMQNEGEYSIVHAGSAWKALASELRDLLAKLETGL